MANHGNRLIIIGSGLGGLLTGYLLSKEGIKVTLLEKHRKFGGCLQTFKRDRYRFDTGMHYIGGMTPGQPLYNYWKYFGLTDKLNLLKMDTDGFDRITFDRETETESMTGFPLAQGFDNFRDQLLPLFPKAKTSLNNYLKKLKEIANAHPLYNLELPSGAFSDPHQSILASSYLSDLAAGIQHPTRLSLRGAERRGNGIPLPDVLAGNNFLYAGNAATTPLSQFGLINHSFISSTWRVAGGSQQITDILAEGIRQHGGEVLAKKRVTSIRKEGDVFEVITDDGDQFLAEQIISDIHPAATLKLLDGIPGQKAYRNRISSLENTTSVFTIYLGLKPQSFPFLNHNVYHHSSTNVWADARSQIPDTPLSSRRGVGGEVHLASGIRHPVWPGQFLFMTPPEPCQGDYANTAVIMSPMDFAEVKKWEKSDSGARENDYFVFKAKKAKLLLEAVYQRFPDLKEAVVTIEISTPLTWRDYTGTPQGSLYGIAKDANHPEKTTIFPKTKIPGLFFTGQSVNLHGAFGVTIGAVMTCGEILGLPYVMKAIKQLA